MKNILNILNRWDRIQKLYKLYKCYGILWISNRLNSPFSLISPCTWVGIFVANKTAVNHVDFWHLKSRNDQCAATLRPKPWTAGPSQISHQNPICIPRANKVIFGLSLCRCLVYAKSNKVWRWERLFVYICLENHKIHCQLISGFACAIIWRASDS
jgi:hypothetical protein